MAIKYAVRCMTCNQWLGDAPEEHLTDHPSHIASEIMYDDTYYTSQDSLVAEPLTKAYNGELYMYNEDRSLYISVNRSHAHWGSSSKNLKNSWLKLSGNLTLNSRKSGHYVPLDSVITKVVFSREESRGDATIYLCRDYDKNDILTSLYLEEGETSTSATSANASVSAGDVLHCYHSSRDGSRDPYVWIEFAGRI